VCLFIFQQSMCISFIYSLHNGHFTFSASLSYTCQCASSQLKIENMLAYSSYSYCNRLFFISLPYSCFLSQYETTDLLSLIFFVCFLSLTVITPSFRSFTYFKSLPSLWNQKYPSPVFYISSLRIATHLSPFRFVIYHALQGFNNSWLEDGSHEIWKLCKELKEGLRQNQL
jgi:hypothetical protein